MSVPLLTVFGGPYIKSAISSGADAGRLTLRAVAEVRDPRWAAMFSLPTTPVVEDVTSGIRVALYAIGHENARIHPAPPAGSRRALC